MIILTEGVERTRFGCEQGSQQRHDTVGSHDDRYVAVLAEETVSRACFRRNKESGAYIPFVNVDFPISVKKTGSDVADVDGSCTRTAQAADTRQHAGNVVDVAVGSAVLVDRESRGYDGLGKSSFR